MFSNNNKQQSSSLFSVQYKIPYDQHNQIITQHLEQSQSELNFLKMKLAEAYEKLQQEITCNTQLENMNHVLTDKMNELESLLQLQKKENNKIKEVLQKIIQNRKILQRQLETVHFDCQKKIKTKIQDFKGQAHQNQAIIAKLKRQHQMQIQQIYDTHRKQLRSHVREIQTKYENKMLTLQNQIQKLTNQKVAQVARLRHQLKCYQTRGSPFAQSKIIQINETRNQLQNKSKSQRNRQFKSYRTNQIQEYAQCNAKQGNQNANTLQSIQEQNVSKWNKSAVKSTSSSKLTEFTDDRQLTNYQIKKRRVQCQLNKLQRMKRPTPQQRQRIEILQKEIYELDSLIAGLKRKIRQKY